jgi:hypothetical protein
MEACRFADQIRVRVIECGMRLYAGIAAVDAALLGGGHATQVQLKNYSPMNRMR